MSDDSEYTVEGGHVVSKEESQLRTENERLKGEVEALRVALHDIFESASRQKSNRDCAIDEGLIATAKAAVRVIRKVCDERTTDLVHHKQLLVERDRVLGVALEALEWKINGFKLREYLKTQFPATIGHFPIEGHLDKQDEAVRQINKVLEVPK